MVLSLTQRLKILRNLLCSPVLLWALSSFSFAGEWECGFGPPATVKIPLFKGKKWFCFGALCWGSPKLPVSLWWDAELLLGWGGPWLHSHPSWGSAMLKERHREIGNRECWSQEVPQGCLPTSAKPRVAGGPHSWPSVISGFGSCQCGPSKSIIHVPSDNPGMCPGLPAALDGLAAPWGARAPLGMFPAGLGRVCLQFAPPWVVHCRAVAPGELCCPSGVDRRSCPVSSPSQGGFVSLLVSPLCSLTLQCVALLSHSLECCRVGLGFAKGFLGFLRETVPCKREKSNVVSKSVSAVVAFCSQCMEENF